MGDTGTYGSIQAAMQISSDPRTMLPLRVGPLYGSGIAPHKFGTQGGAVSYNGPSPSVGTYVAGMQNLIFNGVSAHSVGVVGSATSSAQNLLLKNPAVSPYDVITNFEGYQTIVGNQFDSTTTYAVMCNGEPCIRATSGTTYGAANEAFTTAGTISQVINGVNTILGAGTNFTTATLPGYAYTPSMNLPRVGDIIFITQAGTTYFHRIQAIAGALNITIFPNWAGTSAGPGAGLVYGILRTGYGSYSRVVSIFDSTSGNFFNYYAGNSRTRATFRGTIECYTTNAFGHFMCPQNSAAQDIVAEDIAYYKSFLLYGAGGAIGWSQAGFPSSFTTGFGATDFPAGNITVVDTTDEFQSFEFIGDQLVALFRKSVYLVNPTGTVPEFNFYKLAEPVGANMTMFFNLALNNNDISKWRPSCSGRGAIYYISKTGIMELTGNVSADISAGIIQDLVNVTGAGIGSLSWESSTQTLFVAPPGRPSRVFGYTIPSKAWMVLDSASWTTTVGGGVPSCFTGDIPSGSGVLQSFYHFGSGYYNSTDQLVYFVDSRTGGIAATVVGSGSPTWQWASGVMSQGDSVDGFQFGGFQPEGNGLNSGTTWTIYGGEDPYHIQSRDTGPLITETYLNRRLYSSKTSDPFFAVVLSGAGAVELLGANCYDGKAARGR